MSGRRIGGPTLPPPFSLPTTLDPATLVTARASLTVDLHPSSLADPAAGVRAALAARLLAWCPDLGGVLLAYEEPRLDPAPARVRAATGFVRATATSRVTLFRPRPGALLPATVAATGADYVGLLVLGAFNAAVGAARARRFAPPAEAGGAWVARDDPAHTLVEGADVLFRVLRVRSDGGYVSLVGSLDGPGTGEVGRAAAAAGGGAAPGTAAKKGKRAAKEGGGEKEVGGEKKKKRTAAAAGDGAKRRKGKGV